ncbi:MAG TPA: helix-turn-helix domain-containing protein [Thermomicrobiales bacterium]|jgi:DNA-binding XRE family transcriptional regulator|nr:helix-turn-helix domain-containing protein [Thermomicrobiales bacterium]
MATTHQFRTDSSLDAADRRPPLSVRALRETLGISRERMGRLLDVSARTIQRWEDNDQLPSNRWVRAVLVDLDKILELGKEVFTPEGLQVVMTEPQPAFDGKSGLEMMEAGKSSVLYGEFAGAYEGYIGT